MSAKGRKQFTSSDVELSLLEKLPKEMRLFIYDLLEYSDLLKLREVNHLFKKEINENMNFHLKFDQSCRIIKKLCTRRITSCHIYHFTSRRLFPKKIFYEPKRIKKLTFDGVISAHNIHRLLTQCKYVEHLIFTHQTLGIDSLFRFDVKLMLDLNHMDKVTHLNLQLIRYPHEDPFQINNIETFLTSTFPALKSFRLYCSLFGCYHDLLRFLGIHRNTLEEVELQVGDRGDVAGTESVVAAQPLEMNILERLDINNRNLMELNLTKFRFRDDVLNLNKPVTDVLLSIILNQRNLQVLQVYSPGEISFSNLKDVISKNYNSLQEVVIYNLKINNRQDQEELQEPESLDMAIFSKCLNLKTLALSCASSNSNGTNPTVGEGVFVKMFSLQALPSSLEKLHLTGFTLDGQELVELSTKEGNQLKEILIADAGTMRYSEILKSLLKNCANLRYLNVRPVVLQAANDKLWWKEVNSLSKLYERFMKIKYDPIDDLEGFEATISENDKDWLRTLVEEEEDSLNDSNTNQ